MQKKSIRQRLRDLEAGLARVIKLLPYLQDCIIVTKILMERDIVTTEDIKTEYDKMKQV